MIDSFITLDTTHNCNATNREVIK